MPFATLAVAQEILPIDVTALLAVFMGVSIVLVPVIGLTAISILERRMALIEQQVESIDTNVQKLVETAEFDQNLAAPSQAPAQISGPSSDE